MFGQAILLIPRVTKDFWPFCSLGFRRSYSQNNISAKLATIVSHAFTLFLFHICAKTVADITLRSAAPVSITYHKGDLVHKNFPCMFLFSASAGRIYMWAVFREFSTSCTFSKPHEPVVLLSCSNLVKVAVKNVSMIKWLLWVNSTLEHRLAPYISKCTKIRWEESMCPLSKCLRKTSSHSLIVYLLLFASFLDSSLISRRMHQSSGLNDLLPPGF